MARRTKLNDKLQAKIVDALKKGNYFDASCEASGISKVTGYNWINRGEAELERRNGKAKEGSKTWNKEQPFVNFLNVTRRAMAESEEEITTLIRKAVPDDWRAGAWILEHRHPDKWGKRRFEHTGKDGGAIILKTGMDMSEL